MTFETTQTAPEIKPIVDYSLPEYSEEELAEMEKEDEAFFNEKTIAIVNEQIERLEKILPRQGGKQRAEYG